MPCPLKDKNGNYSDDSPRCNYHIKECGKDSVVEAAIHMEREHWDWWYNANKWQDRDEIDGSIIERPPRTFEVKFPRWHEEGQDPFASTYERKLAAERTRLMSKTVDREHKEEIEEAKADMEPPKRKPGRPATPKVATEGF